MFQMSVQDKPASQYLQNFLWNTKIKQSLQPAKALVSGGPEQVFMGTHVPMRSNSDEIWRIRHLLVCTVAWVVLGLPIILVNIAFKGMRQRILKDTKIKVVLLKPWSQSLWLVFEWLYIWMRNNHEIQSFYMDGKIRFSHTREWSLKTHVPCEEAALCFSGRKVGTCSNFNQQFCSFLCFLSTYQ